MKVSTLGAAAVALIASPALAWEGELGACQHEFRPFNFMGCFKDPHGTALSFASHSKAEGMTIEKCWAICKGNNLGLAGLRFHGSCHCGTALNSTFERDQNVCNLRCSGNPGQKCGGYASLSMYADPTYPGVTRHQVKPYKSVGCYKATVGAGSEGDGSNNSNSTKYNATSVWSKPDDARRVLGVRENRLHRNDTLPAMCVRMCRKRRMTYAGVTNGDQCWCDRDLAPGAVKLPDAECDVSCHASNAWNCGGKSKIEIFRTEGFQSFEPCGHGPLRKTSWEESDALAAAVAEEEKKTIEEKASKGYGPGPMFWRKRETAKASSTVVALTITTSTTIALVPPPSPTYHTITYSSSPSPSTTLTLTATPLSNVSTTSYASTTTVTVPHPLATATTSETQSANTSTSYASTTTVIVPHPLATASTSETQSTNTTSWASTTTVTVQANASPAKALVGRLAVPDPESAPTPTGVPPKIRTFSTSTKFSTSTARTTKTSWATSWSTKYDKPARTQTVDDDDDDDKDDDDSDDENDKKEIQPATTVMITTSVFSPLPTIRADPLRPVYRTVRVKSRS